MNNQPHSSTSNSPCITLIVKMPVITFHPSMDKFYIIWNLQLGLVYILNLPLLLTQNSYLNYSKSTFMPLVKRFSL